MLLDDFYIAIDELNLNDSKLNEERNKLKKIVNDFISKSQEMPIDSSALEQNESIKNALTIFTSQMKNKIQAWAEYFEQKECEEHFRSKLKNNLIVIIYGKVKAGKSTLGNFIAKNKLAHQKAEFSVYDRAGTQTIVDKLQEIHEDDGFAVKVTECTSEIQLFTLGGLVWVDTPGLGSMTKENGDLARKYIEAADFVVFPTSSDSPMQNDEISQIQELTNSLNKSISIIITKSDMPDYKRDSDGKIVVENGDIVKELKNKSVENRQRQNQDVYDRLQASKLGNFLVGDIISISVKMASIGLEQNDEKILVESNLPAFYDMLHEGAIKKANELKQNTPYTSLISLINNILDGNDSHENSLNSVENDFKVFIASINQVKTDIKNTTASIKAELSSQIINTITSAENKIDINNSEAMFKKLNEDIAQMTLSLFLGRIQEIMKNFAIKNQNFIFDSKEFKISEEFAEIEVVRTRAATGGFIGLALGTIAGIALAPVTGGASLLATAGTILSTGTLASAGAWAGEKIGKQFKNSDYRTIKLGDDKVKVIGDFKQNMLSYYGNDFIDSNVKTINEIFLNPLENFASDIEKLISGLKKDLCDLKFTYQRNTIWLAKFLHTKTFVSN